MSQVKTGSTPLQFHELSHGDAIVRKGANKWEVLSVSKSKTMPDTLVTEVIEKRDTRKDAENHASCLCMLIGTKVYIQTSNKNFYEVEAPAHDSRCAVTLHGTECNCMLAAIKL